MKGQPWPGMRTGPWGAGLGRAPQGSVAPRGEFQKVGAGPPSSQIPGKCPEVVCRGDIYATQALPALGLQEASRGLDSPHPGLALH